MFRLSKYACAFAFGLLITLSSVSYASAHCFVGARFFPATLATDDPCVADYTDNLAFLSRSTSRISVSIAVTLLVDPSILITPPLTLTSHF